MTAAQATLIGAVLVFAASIIGALLVRNSTKKAQALDARKVDLDEFREVQARNEAALDRADKRIADLETRLVTEHEARQRSDERADEAEKAAKRAEQRTGEVEEQGKRLARRLSRSERRVKQLEKAMAEAGVPVPPPLADVDL